VNAGDGGIELSECGAQRAWKGISVGLEYRGVRAKNPEVQLAEEECDPKTRGSQTVSMAAGLPLNETSQAKASKVVGHLSGGIRAPAQGGHARAQIAVSKAGGYMREAGQRLTQRLNARVAKPPRGDPNAPETERVL
jgi:hypothetical protein